MRFERPLFLLFLLVPPLVWWLLRPPGHGRPWLTYRLELWLRAARELGLLHPRRSTPRALPAILAAVSLALAAAGPHWGAKAGPDRLLVLLDRSPSMGARGHSGRTRFELALDRLLAEVVLLPPEVELRVVLAGGERLGLEGGQAGRFEEWAERLAAWGPALSGRGELAGLVEGLAARGTPLLVLTDRAGPERSLAPEADGVCLRTLGEAVDNGSLLDLVPLPTWPAPEVEAQARVRPGGGARSLEVRALASGEILARGTVGPAAGPSDPVEVPLSWPRRAGPVEIHLTPPDAFGLDDVLLFTPLPPPGLRVALRAGDPDEGPSPLARAAAHALATGEGRVVLEEEDPDLVVVEGGQLSSLPDQARPAWLLLGTAVAGLTAETLLKAPEPGAWDSQHALLSGLDLSQVGVDRALRVEPGSWPGRVLFRTATGHPLLLATESDPKVVHLLFLPQHSSLGAELLWPRFLHRCLGWFSGSGKEQVDARRPGGAAPDPEESDLDPGPSLLERPLPEFGRPGHDLSAWLLFAALVLLALWLLLLAPGPSAARLSFSPRRG